MEGHWDPSVLIMPLSSCYEGHSVDNGAWESHKSTLCALYSKTPTSVRWAFKACKKTFSCNSSVICWSRRTGRPCLQHTWPPPFTRRYCPFRAPECFLCFSFQASHPVDNSLLYACSSACSTACKTTRWACYELRHCHQPKSCWHIAVLDNTPIDCVHSLKMRVWGEAQPI